MPDLKASMKNGLQAIKASEIFRDTKRVAIKVNLGGGIHGILSSYTDPHLLDGLLSWLKKQKKDVFVCEADMRGHEITSNLLRIRNYFPVLKKHNVPFVNLSHLTPVSFRVKGVPMPLNVPYELLLPDTKIISFAPPKHHWECGITCSQKNMYGALSDFDKSKFHRHYSLIDLVVAAAARIMRPALSIIATKQLGAGMGPHFCVPINFYRAVFARDMLACDQFCAEILGYPAEEVLYHKINKQNTKVHYELLPNSTRIPTRTLKKIYANRIPPSKVKKEKDLLWLQYFLPSTLQFKYYHYLEGILTWINKKFYLPRGELPLF